MQRNSIRLGAGLLIALACSQSVRSQDLAEQQRQIRAAIDRKDTAAAVATLRSVRSANAGAFALNNYDYLLARLSERRGDQREAIANYQSVIDRAGILRAYALWHQARLARAIGDLIQERERLRQLLAVAPGSLLREPANLRLAQSFFESTDYSATIATLRALVGFKDVSVARQALALTGEALLRNGKQAEARTVFGRLITQMPDASRPDDFALSAARGLDGLDKVNSAKNSTLSEADHLQRANIYQFNRDFDDARMHYLAVVDHFAQSASVPDAIYQIARGFYQQAKYAECLTYLQRIERDYSATASARDALGLKAGAYVRLKRGDEAIAVYQQFIDRFPGAPNPERPYLNLIDALRDAGRDQEAFEWVRQTRAKFKGQIGDAMALFAQAKIHLAQAAWANALSELEELQEVSDLGGVRIPGGTTGSEVAFLRGYALEQLGRTQNAVAAYLSVAEGRNEYYGFRANERLKLIKPGPGDELRGGTPTHLAQLLANGEIEAARRATQAQLRTELDPGKRKALLDLLRQIYDKSPAYHFPAFHLLTLGRQGLISQLPAEQTAAGNHGAVADELFFLDLYDEGVPEMAVARLAANDGNSIGGTRQANPSSPGDFEYSLAVYSLRGDLPYPAVRFAEGVWKTVPSDYVMELAPREIAGLLYPTPFSNTLVKEAASRSVDPRFVLSIARQESRFRADAKSVAAARGLMQFISATALDVARELGRRDFRQDDLYDPDTAIQFGSQYLGSLFKQFPAMPEAVAAAYNGGADNIARWVARSRGNDPGRYVPEIGFSQTKDYVFRVMTNYWMYQQLYSDQLQPQ